MATDEMSFLLSRLSSGTQRLHFTAVAAYHSTQDEFLFEHGPYHIPNTGTTIVPVLFECHWLALEICRDMSPNRVTLVQTPPSLEERLIFFACHLLHIPAHRLQVVTNEDQYVPGLCGWTLAWRWLQRTNRETAFVHLERDFAQLSLDRRRIVDRALAVSIQHWDKTNGPVELQHAAYVIRRAFLTNLLMHHTSVHTVTDSNAILAVGHPMQCFPAANDQLHAINSDEMANQGPQAAVAPVMNEAIVQTVLDLTIIDPRHRTEVLRNRFHTWEEFHTGLARMNWII